MRAAEWSESGRGLNLVIGRNFCETPRYAAVTSVVLNTLHQSHSHWQLIVADSDIPVPLISETTSLLLERDTMRLVRRHFVQDTIFTRKNTVPLQRLYGTFDISSGVANYTNSSRFRFSCNQWWVL